MLAASSCAERVLLFGQQRDLPKQSPTGPGCWRERLEPPLAKAGQSRAPSKSSDEPSKAAESRRKLAGQWRIRLVVPDGPRWRRFYVGRLSCRPCDAATTWRYAFMESLPVSPPGYVG